MSRDAFASSVSSWRGGGAVAYVVAVGSGPAGQPAFMHEPPPPGRRPASGGKGGADTAASRCARRPSPWRGWHGACSRQARARTPRVRSRNDHPVRLLLREAAPDPVLPGEADARIGRCVSVAPPIAERCPPPARSWPSRPHAASAPAARIAPARCARPPSTPRLRAGGGLTARAALCCGTEAPRGCTGFRTPAMRYPAPPATSVDRTPRTRVDRGRPPVRWEDSWDGCGWA